MTIQRAKNLIPLVPVTLGESSDPASALAATFDPTKECWRITWVNVAGQPVHAEGLVGGGEWSKPAPAPEIPPHKTEVAELSGGAFPEGIRVWQQLSNGSVAIRSGRRVVGRAPRFPSASLVLCGEKSGVWRDVAFAAEAPEVVIGNVALAVSPSHWLAAYLVPSDFGRTVCRVVQVAFTPATVTPEVWRKLPAYPQPPGMAGMMMGFHEGILIAAGGANFPDLPPWENGRKKFYAEIYTLRPGEAAWKAAGQLPAPRAYAAAVSLPDGLLIIGGENADQIYANTLLLQWDGQQVRIEEGPPLPAATTCAVAALLDGTVYVAGGYGAGAPRLSRNFFWRLNLSGPTRAWEAVPTWPGPTRALAVAAAAGGALYLMSGIEISVAKVKSPPEAAPGLYLKDAYRYRPAAGWEKLPDLPWSAIAAPSPAPITEEPLRVFVLGGVDGRQVGNLPRTISLPDDIIYFDVATHQWKHWQEAWPLPVVSVCAVAAGTEWIIASGEIMAGHRTTETWAWKNSG